MDYRIFVEKHKNYQIEAKSLEAELNLNLNLHLRDLRYINVYDLFGFSKELVEKAKYKVFGEIVTDSVTYSLNLKDKKYIKSVSGKGLMVGIEIDDKYKAADIVAKGIENGVIALTAKNKIRLLPPLNISKEELNKGLDLLLKGMEE